jgi:hypothetical protein
MSVNSPQLEGDWVEMRIIHTLDPCLLSTTTYSPFILQPFPDMGFTSFCIEFVVNFFSMVAAYCTTDEISIQQ